ncbi:MAG: hypothetical protein Kow0025_20400 [Thermodesulfovibrionales bacterium]
MPEELNGSKKELLFVTKADEDFDDGLSYAVYLAEMLGEDLRILFVNRRTMGERFDDLMSAITFAESNEHETAREMLSGGNGRREDFRAAIREKYGGARVGLDVHVSGKDVFTSVKELLRERNRVDMVLVSPSLTRDNNIHKLVKSSSRPVVTMSRQSYVLDSLVERRAH